MNPDSLRIRPLREFPRAAALRQSTGALLARAERILPTMGLHDSTGWKSARAAIDRGQYGIRPEEWNADIRDPLMLEVSGGAGEIAWRDTGDSEAFASIRSQAALASGLASGNVDRFLESCVAAFSCLEGAVPVRRRGDVISGQPSDRPVLFYPRVDDVGAVMAEGLSGWAVGGKPGLLRSIGLYAFFLNAHPFADGNGRVSRLILNACLRMLGMPLEAVVPFRWMIDASQGGYKVKIRRVVLFNEWDALIRFICMSIVVTHEVAKSRRIL